MVISGPVDVSQIVRTKACIFASPWPGDMFRLRLAAYAFVDTNSKEREVVIPRNSLLEHIIHV